ncbi:UNKNOWN [Stylonychia lemnae]|uniref:Inosine/uridine-preferring nucleoside hydrolase domain-containing protein n=1 Tax=Stylonychia lemnae TaxID=5949 RepID=A0A078A0S3_STYLE|nr:UNKNOWN [Stylonychia lemnae]|eukprot:CDW75457.1 UNKNOWN [Stylonychia lemnae]
MKGCDEFTSPNDYVDKHYGVDGFGGFQIENKEKIQLNNVKEQHGVDFIIEQVNKYPNQVTLLCLAPLTNICKAFRKDPSLPDKVKSIVFSGGTYLAQGNTKCCCSEFNVIMDPQAAEEVFQQCQRVTMVPIEIVRSFRQVSQEYVRVPFSYRTKKGSLVYECYKVALKNSDNIYDITDPCAVAVAFCPEVVQEYYEKSLFVEVTGKFTKGMVVVDWRDTCFEKRHHSNIIAKVDLHRILEILEDSVKE